MLRWMVLALLATPAMGQDRQIIDYDALFRDKAAEVVTEQRDGLTIRTLNLPGNVVVQDTGTSDGIVAFDQSDGGAVGCFLMIYVQLGDALKICPALGTAEDRVRHAAYVSRVNVFVAANAYPPMTVAELEGLLDTYAKPTDQAICGRFDDIDMDGFIAGFLGPDMDAQLDKALATPRLPVNNPCL
jgi:hypothetical protein